MLPLSLFPYPSYRPFQEEFIQRVYTAAQILCDIPTGVGKSVSALCGSLADREGEEKVIALTRTKSQSRIFLEETRRIARHLGQPLLIIPLRSKQESCPLYRREEVGYEEFLALCRLKKDCPHRLTYYERKGELEALREELAELLFREEPMGYGELVSRASPYGCPHRVFQDLAREAPLLVASYPYLLHPHLRGPFLSQLHLPMEDLLLILDEAHNLHGMDFLGRELAPRTLALASREMKRDLSRLRSLFQGRDERLSLRDFLPPEEVLALYEAGVRTLERRAKKGKKVSYAYRLGVFLGEVLEMEEDANWAFFRQGGRLHLKPLFPADLLSPLTEAKKLVLMSGTFSPVEGYRELFSLPQAEVFSLPSHFPRENRLLLGIRRGMNTSLKRRETEGEALWRNYAETLETIHGATEGTTLAFFPSYEVLEAVGGRLEDALREPRGQRDLEALLEEIRSRGHRLLLAVAGGKMSEGVEYTFEESGEKRSAIGSVVQVGFPFPPPDFEKEMKSRLYEARFGQGKGFLLLSVLPMVNRVLQSIGRAIRSEGDRACIVFLDDRTDYYRFFPEEVRHEVQLLDPEEIAEEVRYFHGRRRRD
jgi:DNA excision repair protein ERCC-2